MDNSKNIKTSSLIASALIIVALLLGGCTPATPAIQGQVEVRIAILPIIDALPMYVAEKQGYFQANGVSANFIPSASAAERDQLIAANQADAMINDLISVALYNKQAVQVQTVRFARTANPDTAMYSIMAAKDSGFTTPGDLADLPIGISQGTIIDYVTSRLLEEKGLETVQIQSIAVPKINERMALLNSGEIKAATLPEPFGTMAAQDGAITIINDSAFPEYGHSVISFRKAFIDQNPQVVKNFLKAIEQAVADINENPEAWQSLLGEYQLVPEALADSYPVPAFPYASIPSQDQFQDVIDWAITRQLIRDPLDYATSITGQYLPEK